jgi:hypothetical protein
MRPWGEAAEKVRAYRVKLNLPEKSVRKAKPTGAGAYTRPLLSST